MKLRQLCDGLGIKYNEKNPKLSLNVIKKNYLVEQNGNKKDYSIIRQLTDEEKFLNTNTILLHGVTASGKTEVYFKLIDDTIKSGKNVLFLAPEIALASQLTKRLAK